MSQSAPTAAGAPSQAAVRYMVIALFFIYMLNFVDRLLFGFVQEQIKHELKLSDFQLGLLGGPPFAIVYTLAAFPIAWVAERRSRVTVIAVAFAAWSGMTAFCGLASSFAQMLVGRVGVAFGESGCTPAAYSVISDAVPLKERGRSIFFYTAGAPLGSLVAAVAGTWFAQNYGWRMAFLVCGGVGMAAAVIFRLTVREPARSGGAAEAQPFFATARALLAKPSYLLACLGGGIAGIANLNAHQYLVSFLIRSHHLSLPTAGLVAGVFFGGFGIVTMLAGGAIMDLLRARIPRIGTLMPGWSLIWAGTCLTLGLNVPNTVAAVTLVLAAGLGFSLYIPAMAGLAQDVAAPRMRATAAALMLGFPTLFGYGVGVPVAGYLSDLFAARAMAAGGLSPAACADMTLTICASASALGLRQALTVGMVSTFIGGACFLAAGRTLDRDTYRP